jgi:hypothetical protein
MSDAKYTPVEGFFVTIISAFIVTPVIAVIMIVLFPIAMLSAWIRWLLWGWFAVPYLHLPMVPYWAILGLGLLAGTFSTVDQPTGYEPTQKEHISRAVTGIVVQLAALGVGYLVRHYLLH